MLKTCYHKLPLETSRVMDWAASASHLGGLPRRVTFLTVGALSKLWTSFLNTTRVQNQETLHYLMTSRSPGTPLITVSNHTSTLDDPLMWGLRGLPIDPKLARWTLAADDICFTNPLFSYFFRLAKCIPVTRGGGIYQSHMNEALARINEGEWLHMFPEGKVYQEHGSIRRLKWGTASLIARAAISPIVLPIAHYGFEKVMPEKYCFGRRPLVPLCFKNISIVVGEPVQFDVPSLRKVAHAQEIHTGSKISSEGSVYEAENNEVRWLYSHMSEQIRLALQELLLKAKSLSVN